MGFDVKKLAQNEIEKLAAQLKQIDADHDGLKDLDEAVKLFEDADQLAKALHSGSTAADIVAAIKPLEQGLEHLAGIAKAAGVSV